MAREGEYPPSPAWMHELLCGLEPQLSSLEALPALQLVSAFKEFHTRPTEEFTVKLQACLAHLTKKCDAMGVATLVQGLVAVGVSPSVELQHAVAKGIKKGLARPSQGMGGTPVWILLGSLLQAANMAAGAGGAAGADSRVGSWVSVDGSAGAAAAGSSSSSNGGVITPELLDEVLLQVAAQLSASAVNSSKMCRQVLPSLTAAFVPGGCWALAGGQPYTPGPVFCKALCEALLQLQELQAQGGADLVSTDGWEGTGELSGLLWLGLLVRFGDMGGLGGFRPSEAWVRTACETAFCQCWGGVLGGAATATPAAAAAAGDRLAVTVSGGREGGEVWQGVPGPQLAAWLGAIGRLQHEPTYLPGWPSGVLSRLQGVLGDLSGHELSVGLLGVAQQQQAAEMAAAGVLPAAAAGGSNGSSMLAALAAVKPQLLAAAEAVSLRHLSRNSKNTSTLDAGDLAMLGHALQQLGHTPAPGWVNTWSACVAEQIPSCPPAAAVLQIVALAGFSARPSGDLLQGLVDRCQEGLGQLELPQLLGFMRALLLLGYRPESGVLQGVLKAGQAAAARAGQGRGRGVQQVQAEMLSQLQQVVVQLAG